MAAFEPVDLTHEEETALGTITEGTSKFAVSLYRALASKQTGNVFVSPLSVQMVLALAYTGAKGETAQELAALLALPEKIEDTYAGYQSLIKVLQAPVLKLANRMFVEKTAGVKEGFQKNAEKYFHSPAEALDFRSAYDKSREKINSWVENQTNKKITNLLPPGTNTINSDTRLVLVNAIHFKADWMSKFREEGTKEEPFHVSKAKTVQVQMMHAKKEFHFAHDKELQAKMLQLDYEGDNFYMIVILPDDIEGLPALEAKLEKVNLSERIRRMKMSTVKVALPKFKMEETMKLNEILESLGAKAMFEGEKADFSGLSNQRLVVSEIIHKACIEVNEKGTEAAAATALVMEEQCCMIPPRDEVFIADHPFVFFITSRFHESALFFGRYKTPYL